MLVDDHLVMAFSIVTRLHLSLSRNGQAWMCRELYCMQLYTQISRNKIFSKQEILQENVLDPSNPRLLLSNHTRGYTAMLTYPKDQMLSDSQIQMIRLDPTLDKYERPF